MEKAANDKATNKSHVPKCTGNPSPVVSNNTDDKSLPQIKKNVRAIPNSLLKGTKSSTARAITQRNPKDNKAVKSNSR